MSSEIIYKVIIDYIEENKKYLSTRSQNVIDSLLDYDLDYFIPYIIGEKNVMGLRNVGLRSSIELKEFFQKINESILLSASNNNLKIIENRKNNEIIIDKEEDIKKILKIEAVIVDFISIHISELSGRARNIVNDILDISINSLIEYIYGERNIKSLRNVGIKTIAELERFFTKIHSFIEVHKDIISEEQNLLYNLKIYFNSYSKTSQILDNPNILKNKEFPIYKFFYLLFIESYFLNKKSTLIFQNYLGLFDHEKMTLEGIGKLLGLTRERIRQIYSSLDKIISKNNRKLIQKFPNLIAFTRYDKYLNQLFFKIDNDIVSLINSSEESNFSLKDVFFLTKLIFNNNFYFIEKNIKNDTICILIKKKLFDSFDFTDFIEDLTKKVHERRTYKLELDFEGYLYKFLKNKTYNNLQSVKLICEELIFSIFDIILSTEGCIVFENSENNLKSKIINIFKEVGKPLQVNYLVNLLKNKFPSENINENKIRSTLQRFNDFSYIGRSSTYFLSEWEKDITYLKGGSIRDIILDFLRQKKEPIHIDVIIKYILKYRKTSRINILTNLKLDSKKRFNFLPGGFIELRE